MTLDPPSDLSSERFDISICVSTLRRPQRLARLLESLRGLAGTDAYRLEIVVIDNDAAASARPIVDACQEDYPHPIRYGVEPQQNIALARNRTVQMARGTWVAFIDDDEVATPHWLAAYWQMQRQCPGDGYFGRVMPRLEQESAPTWLDQDVFFALPRFATGTPMLGPSTYTTNALIRRCLFDTHPFDPSFKFGGEDIDLFSRMIDTGAQFYYCDEAVTTEYYPPERVCFRWLLKRHFRGGFLYTRIDRQRRPGFARQLPGLIKALGGIGLFTLMVPFEAWRGSAYAVKRILRLSLQVGHVWEFCHLSRFFEALTFEEYQLRCRGKLS
jgi:succinoglycan biosynthesis protein ExoM